MKRHIEIPMDTETRLSLHAGDMVLISGTVYTARDAAHARIHEMIEKHEPLPFDLLNAGIYYVGPTPAVKGHALGAAGPTTSSRMDVYTPELLEHGLKVMIGKGRRSEEVREAIKKNQAVYFAAPGGAGALLSSCIIKAEPVAFAELLSEAVLKLTLKDFPCFVCIDAEGEDIYDTGKCMPGRR